MEATENQLSIMYIQGESRETDGFEKTIALTVLHINMFY